MAKNKVSEWSSTPANNTDIGGIDIAEGCAPSGINNSIRELMAQVKDMQAGTDNDNFTVGGNLAVNGAATFNGATTFANDIGITNLTVSGNATFGDASTDTVTFNANTIVIPNGFNFSSDSAIKLPIGTTAQRPTGTAGLIRANSTTNRFEGYINGVWGSIGGGATGGGTDTVFVENSQTITTNYTIQSGFSASSTGPITINSGVTITVPSGSRWVVL